MEKWASLNEENKPFGLDIGDNMTWKGLCIKRREMLGPNWNYIVTDGSKTYLVNVFDPSEGSRRITIQGEWRGSDLDTHILFDVESHSAEDALVQALARVLRLPQSGRTTDG